MRKKFSLFPLINGLLLICVALLCIYPILYIVFASLSEPDQLMRHSGVLVRPLGFTFKGYELALKNPNIVSSFINTTLIVVLGTLASILTTSGGAYVLSRRGPMLVAPLMKLVIVTMYFSGGLIPLYLLVHDLGLYDNRATLVLLSLVSTWNLIVMRTSFLAISESIEESAKIDGAGPATILFRVFLPISKPLLASMALFYGVAYWNNWFSAMVFLQSRSKYPLSLILREILIANDMTSMTNMTAVGTYSSDMYQMLVKYAVIVLTTLPILLIYPFFQKYFVSGVMVGSVKG